MQSNKQKERFYRSFCLYQIKTGVKIFSIETANRNDFHFTFNYEVGVFNGEDFIESDDVRTVNADKILGWKDTHHFLHGSVGSIDVIGSVDDYIIFQCFYVENI